jgi:hypothetical protein
MKSFLGISASKISSMVFLLLAIMISLTLGSITFLVSDNEASVPDVGMSAGLEGIVGSNEKVETAKKEIKRMKKVMGDQTHPK